MCQWCNPPYERRQRRPLEGNIDLLSEQVTALVARARDRFDHLAKVDLQLAELVEAKNRLERTLTKAKEATMEIRGWR